MRVAALWIYPVKSFAGVALSTATAGARGFDGDRRWMVVDGAGRFVTQRERPEMARLFARLDGDSLWLDGAGTPLELPRAHDDGARVAVTVWSWHGVAARHDAGSAWVRRALAADDLSLVYLPDDVTRPASDGSGVVGFADGFPYLLAGDGSLAELQRRIPSGAIDMRRFRPNIVVEGVAPFAEDDWRTLGVGALTLHYTKRCERCVVTTVDPDSGARGAEPLRTLAEFRRTDNQVWFGINLVPRLTAAETCRVSVGDAVRVTA